MLKAVLFDLDGVITDSAKYHYQAWKRLADELDIPFDEAYNEKLKGVSRMESLNLILENGGQRDSFSLAEKEEMATKKNELYKELINQMTPEDILPGIKLLVEDLKKRGIKTAIASVSHNALFIIKQLGMQEAFDHIVDASSIKRAKPFPDIFLAAAQAVGVEPSECVGIEDAKAGIEAIKAAGIYAIGVGTPSQMADADLVLESTAQLSLELVERCIKA